MKKNIDGTPWFTYCEKSSLAVMAGMRWALASPKASLNTASVLVTSASLLTMAAPPLISCTSGAGAPAIALDALATRRTPSSSLARTAGL